MHYNNVQYNIIAVYVIKINFLKKPSRSFYQRELLIIKTF